MFFDKIKKKESGILLYGITPPKAQTSADKVAEIGIKSLALLETLDIDGLVVYDVQDESARTSEERPFPFSSALDPLEYTREHLHSLKLCKIIYRPAGKFSKNEIAAWLDQLKTHGCYPVFVGLPSPDSVPVTSLPEAYRLWREGHQHTSVIGAVTIPERHAQLNDEDIRMLDKVACGVSFFISQCIFNVEYTRNMLAALTKSCAAKNQDIPTVIFTLTVCGSMKTLQFMEWLGIHVPDDVKEELRISEDPAKRSVQIAVDVAKTLISYCRDHQIPFGFNIESVATRKAEVEASLELLHSVRELMAEAGLWRTSRSKTISAN